MTEKYKQLVAHLAEIDHVRKAAGLLGWDQRTQMPTEGAKARAAQLATLSRIAHQMFVSDKTARLLDDAASELNGADYDSMEASMLRVVREDYEQATKLPTEFVTKMTELTALSRSVWVKARANNDFKSFQSSLEEIVQMKIHETELRGYDEHPYDALLGQFERGTTTSMVKRIFDEHKPGLVELIAAVSEHENAVSDDILHQPFDKESQREFATWVVKAFGYDFNRGREDETVHPFASSFSRGDARITTRYYDNFLSPSLFGMMHEAGHAMYEQGVGEELEGTMLARGTSLGVHESQSRMWENIVGRSKGFWSWALPKLEVVFPSQFGGVNVDTFYKSINKVQRQFIRVEADEATYNLHIMLRFDLELDLITQKVKVADLPREWNARFEQFFGIVPPTDTLGVLQDTHWGQGSIGYFSTYALGNLLSVQYYNRALLDHPNLPDEIAQGKFDTLLHWLNENIHQHGRKFTADELTRRVTGEGIQSHSYMTYLTDKFSDIYGL